MKLRILTVPFDPDLGRFDDEAVCGFLADKDLLGVRDHFFVHDGQPHLAVVLAYRPGTGAAKPAPGTKKQARRESWRELLEPGDLPLFNTLREWRGRRSKQEGIPPYVICNNRQLAQVVRARPRTLNKLGEIEGFGSAKLKKYGAEMLALLHTPAETPPAGAAGKESRDDGRDE